MTYICPYCQKADYYHEMWCSVWDSHHSQNEPSAYGTPGWTSAMTELERVKEEVVFGFYEEEYPSYVQGYTKGAHELSSPITADEANGLVEEVQRLVVENENLQRELDETKAALKEIFDEYMPIKQKIVSERL